MTLLRKVKLYLTRKKAKNLLLFFILFFMGVLVLVSLSILRSNQKALKDLRMRFGSNFTLTQYIPEEDKTLWKGLERGSVYIGPVINDELVAKVLQEEGIVDYTVEKEMILDAGELKLFEGMWTRAAKDDMEELQKAIQENAPEEDIEYWEEWHEIADGYKRSAGFFGVRKSEYSKYFRTNAFELVQGEHIQPEDKRTAVISEYVAEQNNLKIGDTIAVHVNMGFFGIGGMDDIAGSFDFTVKGIFRINSSQAINIYTVENEIAQNYIYLDVGSCLEMDSVYRKALTGNMGIEDKGADQYASATFILEDARDMDAVLERINNRDDINMYYYRAGIDNSIYEKSVAPLNMLNWILWVLVIIVFVFCIAICTTILMMRVQDRKREAAILMSMGMERKEIAGQQILEVVVVAILAFVLAFGTARLISMPISNAALTAVTPEEVQEEAKSEQELIQEILNGNFEIVQGTDMQENAELPDTFNSTVTFMDFLLLLLGGLLLVTAAMEIALYRVLWLKPKDILHMMS